VKTAWIYRITAYIKEKDDEEVGGGGERRREGVTISKNKKDVNYSLITERILTVTIEDKF